MLRLFSILSILFTTPATAAPTWKADANHSIELSDGQHVIVRFLVDPAPRDPHFDILATADGRNTVWVAPPDHVWHYGVWFSWKYLNGVNFWETNPQTGKQQGVNRIEDAMIEAKPDGDTATIRYRELAFPDPDGPAVLEDAVEIEIRRPSGSAGPQITWRITTTALADATLGRTPISGEPDGRGWGGYAGFSWRGAMDFKDVRFTSSESAGKIATHGDAARWVNVTGTLHEKPAGLLMIDHPSNPRHPAPWYLTDEARLPFWFASPSPLFRQELSLKKGESFRHAYRIIPHDGCWDESHITRAMDGFGGE